MDITAIIDGMIIKSYMFLFVQVTSHWIPLITDNTDKDNRCVLKIFRSLKFVGCVGFRFVYINNAIHQCYYWAGSEPTMDIVLFFLV